MENPLDYLNEDSELELQQFELDLNTSEGNQYQQKYQQIKKTYNQQQQSMIEQNNKTFNNHTKNDSISYYNSKQKQPNDYQLSFLNSSLPSINYQQKYYQQLQQISSLRSQNRNLKQQLKTIKINKQGYQQENFILKSLLNQKKDIIVKINQDLIKSNFQIGRLEDLLSQQNNKVNGVLQEGQLISIENKKIKKQIKTIRKQLLNKQQEFKNLENKYKGMIINQKQKSKQQRQKYFQGSLKRMKEIIKDYNNHNNKNIESINFNNQIIFENQQKSPYKQLSQKQKPILSQKDVLNLILKQLQQFKILSQQKQQKIKTVSSTLKQKQEFVQILEKKISILEMQFNQATSLIQEQKDIIYQKKNQVISVENRIIDIKQKTKKSKEKLQKKSFDNIKQLIQILHDVIPSEIYQIIMNNKIQQSSIGHIFYKQELQNAIKLNLIKKFNENNIKNSSYKQQLSQLEEQFDVLSLKYQTLKRQYDAVIDDNKRLLKFSNLSRYRSQRNNIDMNMDIDINDKFGKQNLLSSRNFKENALNDNNKRVIQKQLIDPKIKSEMKLTRAQSSRTKLITFR